MLVLGIAIGYGLAKLYLRYRDIEYSVTATIQIQEDQGQGISEQIVIRDFGYEDDQNLETKIQMMKGRGLLLNVVNDLGLDVRFFRKGRIRNTELYRSSSLPIHVKRYLPTNDAYGKLLTLNLIGNNQFAFGMETELDTFRLGLPFSSNYGSFLFEQDSSVNSSTTNLLVQFSKSWFSRWKVCQCIKHQINWLLSTSEIIARR